MGRGRAAASGHSGLDRQRGPSPTVQTLSHASWGHCEGARPCFRAATLSKVMDGGGDLASDPGLPTVLGFGE